MELAKSSFVSLLLILLSGMTAGAQIITTCKIKYNYDAGGNRIKRYYGCDQSGPGTPEEYRPDGILSNLSPNPTYGPLTGTFGTSFRGAVTVKIVNLAGVPILQQTFTQVSGTFTVDISQQIPGTYFLTVYAFNMMESYTITKL
jgi:hypothetical protein